MDINESQGSLETISLTDLIEISNFSDLIFLSGASMVFRVATALLADHKDMLLQCRNFEQLMDYFKTTLPCMGASQLERVIHEVMTRPVVVSAFKSIATPHTCFRLGRSCFFRSLLSFCHSHLSREFFLQALTLDISRQLTAYEVEYHVLQEETVAAGLASPPNGLHAAVAGADVHTKWDRLEKTNQALQKQVRDLQNQVHMGKTSYRILEANLTAHQAMYTRLERQVPSTSKPNTLPLFVLCQRPCVELVHQSIGESCQTCAMLFLLIEYRTRGYVLYLLLAAILNWFVLVCLPPIVTRL